MSLELFFGENDLTMINVTQLLALSTLLLTAVLFTKAFMQKKPKQFSWLKVYISAAVTFVVHRIRIWELASISSSELDTYSTTVVLASLLFIPFLLYTSLRSAWRAWAQKRKAARRRDVYYD